MTVSVLLGFFLLGFLGIFFLESYYAEKFLRKEGENKSDSDAQGSGKMLPLGSANEIPLSEMERKKHSRLIRSSKMSADLSLFFSKILPLEFSYSPWYKKFWLKCLEKHPYIAYLAPTRGRANYRSKKWLGMCFEILNLVFVDSIFAPIASPDAGVCDGYTTAKDCLRPQSIDLTDPLCAWNEEEKKCEFREISENMGVIIITCLVIKILEGPLMLLCEYLVDQAANAGEEEDEADAESERREKRSNNKRSRNSLDVSEHESMHSMKIVPFDIIQTEKTELIISEHGPSEVSRSAKIAPLNDEQSPRCEVRQPVLAKQRRSTKEANSLASAMIVQNNSEVEPAFAPARQRRSIDEIIYNSRSAAALDRSAYTKALIHLACRLAVQQHRIDNVTVDEEVDAMIRQVDVQFKSDVIDQVIIRHKITDKRCLIEKARTLKGKVERARMMSRTIIREMAEIDSRDEMEIYLVKRFVIELLDGVHRRVAERFFFDEVEEEISVYFRAFCILLLILIIGGELTYIFLTGIIMGANATTVWFICLSVVVLQGKRCTYTSTNTICLIYYQLLFSFNRLIYFEALVYLVQFRCDVVDCDGQSEPFDKAAQEK